MTDTLPRSESEMFVYDITPANDGRVHVYLLVPGQSELVGLPIEEAKRFAGDLTAAIGRYELPAESQPLSDGAQRILNYVHRHMELNRCPPTRDEIADHVGVGRRTIEHQRAMKELEQKGWYKPRAGYRSDDWGGVYKRPLKPPFLRSKPAEIGQLPLLAEAV